MTNDALAQEGPRAREPALAPLSDLHQTLFELLRLEIDKHPDVSSGVVPRDGRPVLFVVHGGTGQTADIGLKAEGNDHWFTWVADFSEGRAIGTSERPADIAAVIVQVLAEGASPKESADPA